MAGQPKRRAKEMMQAREALMEALGKSDDDKPFKLKQGGPYEQRSLENQAPEKAAEAMLAVSDPWHTLKSAAKACGLSEGVVDNLVERLRTRYNPVNSKLREVQTGHLIKLIEDRALMALEYMDEAAFAQANLRDLTIALGVLIEKRQLLSGEPTAILSTEQRRELNEVLPLVLEEAKRRGVVIDGHATPEAPRAMVPTKGDKHFSKTERKMRDRLKKHDRVRERDPDANL